MKNEQQQKISLEKLTIAKINTGALHDVKGGSSAPPSVFEQCRSPKTDLIIQP